MVWHFHITEPSKPLISCTATGWIMLYFLELCSCRFLFLGEQENSNTMKFKSVVKYYKETIYKVLSSQHSYTPVQLRAQSMPMCLITTLSLLQRLFLSNILWEQRNQRSFMSFIQGLAQARGEWGLEPPKFKNKTKKRTNFDPQEEELHKSVSKNNCVCLMLSYLKCKTSPPVLWEKVRGRSLPKVISS